jgi:AcrR family transcriptional regulator
MVRSVKKNVRIPRPGGGLRERKKLAVRRALGSAALRLAAERGLENVTIEEITAEAGVSVRTFGNYFASKYEAICALGTDRARRIGAELLARPADEPLWDALVAAMLAHYEGADRAPGGQWLAGLKLVLSSPPIRGEYLKVSLEMQRALAEAIAARTGISLDSADKSMYPEVLAGAVTAAAQVAVRRWAAAEPPVPLAPLLRRALDELATACSRLPALRGAPGPIRAAGGAGWFQSAWSSRSARRLSQAVSKCFLPSRITMGSATLKKPRLSPR